MHMAAARTTTLDTHVNRGDLSPTHYDDGTILCGLREDEPRSLRLELSGYNVHTAIQVLSRDIEASPPGAIDTVGAYTSSAVPGITLADYGLHLARAILQRDEALALGMVLVLRHWGITGLRPTAFTAHRLLLAAVHVAQKAHYDHCACNSYMAVVGGVTHTELNVLEVQFLFDLDFRVQVTREDWLQTLRFLGVVHESGYSTPSDEFRAAE